MYTIDWHCMIDAFGHGKRGVIGALRFGRTWLGVGKQSRGRMDLLRGVKSPGSQPEAVIKSHST